MHVSQALNIIKPNQVEILADLLPIELINSAYELTDTVTLRKRKLILESMLWLLVGMAIYNDKSMADIVNMLDIAYRTGKPFVVPSALPQRRKISENQPLKRSLSVRSVIGSLRLTCRIGMVRLLCVDGVLWRAEDSKDINRHWLIPMKKD
nr:transposase domain-containing protein [Vibrio diabolicus]